ncbi:hypothetical protein KDK_63870 [Dictyobacter kobayashii]|uniref:Uncharacterized protein n=1 Tax=Dictyobacter kobayashii TaxID=2014872 RepID=A0A402AU29_9CHLR|nr:hypothetical protein KDK_63870 [Dictyobacter kobayashii]
MTLNNRFWERIPARDDVDHKPERSDLALLPPIQDFVTLAQADYTLYTALSLLLPH